MKLLLKNGQIEQRLKRQKKAEAGGAVGGLVKQGPECERRERNLRNRGARDAVAIKSAHNCKNRGVFKAEELQTTSGNSSHCASVFEDVLHSADCLQHPKLVLAPMKSLHYLFGLMFLL